MSETKKGVLSLAVGDAVCLRLMRLDWGMSLICTVRLHLRGMSESNFNDEGQTQMAYI